MSITTRRIEANGLSFTVDEAGEGDAVALCLHGFPESRHSWRHQLPLLADLGWRAVAPDLRGYGDSDKPKGVEAYALPHLVADAAAMFDALGARRRLLIGHDWGAALAWAFALEQARPLDGLVVMNVPHPAVFAREIKAGWDQRLRSWYMAFFQLPVLPELLLGAGGARGVAMSFTREAVDKSRFPPEVVEPYRRNAARPGALTPMINWYRANIPAMARAAPAQWPVIETPTLMVWGKSDSFLSPRLTEGYDGLVRDFTLEGLDGVSHWVQQEAPERVNAILTDWLTAKGLAPAG